MGDYVLVHRQGDQVPDTFDALRSAARGLGLTVDDLNPRTWVASWGPGRPTLRTIGGWRLLGDVLDRRAPALPQTRHGDPWDYERKLMARIWGRYVGFRFGFDGVLEAVLRDPSGALECVTWKQDDVTVVASTPPLWLIDRLRPPWRIDRKALAQALRDPLSPTTPLMLHGPQAVQAGTVQPLSSAAPPEILWRPADFARRSLEDRRTPEQAAHALREAVDEAVLGLAGLGGPLGAEVSGGLDSSLVAASLVAGKQPVTLWMNAVGSTPEADERPYVEALAAGLAFEPLCVPHATGAMTEALLEDASSGFRPGLNAMDRPHDEDWARRFQKAGVAAVMTGKGGDSILLQAANAEVFTDLWRRRGYRALFDPDAIELAAANEVSMWTLMAQARRSRRRNVTLPVRDHPLFADEGPRPSPHPWLEGLEAFGPAKAQQIIGVIDSISRHAPSALSACIDVRHPLCAQPVIEACLSIPTPMLTLGGRDRGLARRAFADRLPAKIVNRRTKGDMTRIYGRMIYDNLHILRPWLIEGRLAALGLVDRAAADRLLRRESLMATGRYSPFLVAAAFEAWVRAWETRLGPTP